MARKFSEQRFDTGSVEINYAVSATSGPPLVLLHGLGARWQVFMPLMPALALDWQVYAIDLRGHGMSGRQEEHYRLQDYVADIICFIQRQIAEPVVVYGHSLGGWIATAVAAQLSDSVRAIVIADSAIYPDSLDPELSLSYLANVPITMRSLAKSLVQLDPNVMVMFRDGRLLESYDPELLMAQIKCPTLLLQGDPAQGALMTDADVARAMARLPQATHVRFDNLGHGMHVEDADTVYQAVKTFLAAL